MHHRRFHGARRLGILLSLAAVIAVLPRDAAWAAKNVILMIADGSGHHSWSAASMYEGKLGKQPYDQPGWLRLSCCTYPLNLSHQPTGDVQQDQSLVYEPLRAWDATPKSAKPGDFAGYLWLTATPTDSAAAATALATGRKTYNNAINWSNDNRPLRGATIAEIAKAHGKSVGVVTTVQWSDATPAGLGGAHNVSRTHHAQIANEMLDAPWLSVIMGAGNPDFDDDGRPLRATKKHDYQWVGGQETWQALKSGRRPWKLIESKTDFEALASGPTPPRALGVAQAGSTLQERRSRDRMVLRNVGAGVEVAVELPPQPRSVGAGVGVAVALPPQPFVDPFNRNVPSLAVMAQAAIHCLDENPRGYYLMIEGGAVDWANHANEPDRMMEEQIDYVQAVAAVVAWIESHGGWNDTLLILTADHETGLIWGPDSGKVAFQPLEDRGSGKLPGMKYNSHGHSNSLVPLYARGPGSQRFAALVRGNDSTAAASWHYSGQFVDNTDVFSVMRTEVEAK